MVGGQHGLQIILLVQEHVAVELKSREDAVIALRKCFASDYRDKETNCRSHKKLSIKINE